MRALGVSAVLAAFLAAACAELVTISDVVELEVGGDEPAADLAPFLRTDVFRELDGQLVVQVFNEASVAVRDVELEIERVSRSGKRRRLGDASIGRRIGAGSMDQTRTSVFVDKREVKHVEARVTGAEPAD